MPLIQLADTLWHGTYVNFTMTGHSPSGKTDVWNVAANGGPNLGEVKWFARWRKYCFCPAPDTIFEETCLADIGEFALHQTTLHRSKK